MNVKKWTEEMTLKERQRNFITDLIEQCNLEDYICTILEEKLITPEETQKLMDGLLNHGLMMVCGEELHYHKADYNDSYYKGE